MIPPDGFCQIKKAGSTSSVAIIIEIRRLRAAGHTGRAEVRRKGQIADAEYGRQRTDDHAARGAGAKDIALVALFLPKTIRDMDRAIDADAEQQRQADDIGEIERDLKQQDKAGGKEPAGQDGQQYQHGVRLTRTNSSSNSVIAIKA